MKKLFYVLFLPLCSLLLSGCSSLIWGEFLVPEKASIESKKVYRKDWSLYTTIGAPCIYESTFDNNISYIAYPVLMDGTTPLGIGPIFVPIIPFWWVKYFEHSNEKYDCKKIKIIWKGNLNEVKKIGVYHLYVGNEHKGERTMVSSTKEEIIYIYTFKEKLTKKSKLILKTSEIDKFIQLNYIDNIMYTPYFSFGGK